ncbi:MAG: YicC/YloC family endoribonuclease [Bacteroidota bacterium]|nr:YicC/YloC family endoribonuclease [Bacteroidota bacterium]
MLKSMTGFGISSVENDVYSISVEIKSVNSKSQDFSFKLPKNFQDKEVDVKTLLGQTLERGKVSVNIEFARKGNIKPKLVINPDLFKAYYEDINKNAQAVGINTNDILRTIIGLPDVFDVDKSDKDLDHDWETLFGIIKDAAVKCNAFREKEGAALTKMLLSYIGKIESLLEKIIEQDPKRIEKIREKIKTRLEDVIPIDKIDQNRFEQELIFYIEKLDIEEEKVRLKNHLEYFAETMKEKEGNGKKLGFIAQEIGREINTIGSKCNDSIIQKCVVEMKEELEKIKEQTLNVL